MAIDSIAMKLMDYSFEIISPKMQLCVTPNYSEVVFEGHGRIWINRNDQMCFKMTAPYTASDLESDWLLRLRVFGMTPQAMSIRENEYLQLRAHDVDGHEWVTNWMIPSVDFRGKHLIIWGQIVNISSFRSVLEETQDETASFVIAKPPRLPFTAVTMTKKEQDGEVVQKSWAKNRQKVTTNDLEVCLEQIEDDVLYCINFLG